MFICLRLFKVCLFVILRLLSVGTITPKLSNLLDIMDVMKILGMKWRVFMRRSWFVGNSRLIVTKQTWPRK